MRSCNLSPLAYSAALLPLFAIHLSYILAAYHGHVEWCIPYIDSCTSISAVGRQYPESYFFKTLMIISAGLFVSYWYLSSRWLLVFEQEAVKSGLVLVTLGIVASVGLTIYILALGGIDERFRMQRRIGVTLFYGFSYVNQLLITRLLVNANLVALRYSILLSLLKLLAITVLAVGLISVAVSLFDRNLHHRIDDAVEWTLTLLICLHVLVSARMWQRAGFYYQNHNFGISRQ